MATRVLAGDIGGTKTALAVYRFEEGRTARLEAEETFPSRGYRGLGEIVHEFLGTHGEPLVAAAFGIAGAVLDGEVSATNLPWKLSERKLAEEIGSERVRLLNDLETTAYGAQAANLALTTMALGGVYVGGGIVTKLLPKVESGLFMEAFRDAGRFEPLMRETPVRVILNPKASLMGAAQAALDLALDTAPGVSL